LRYGGFDVRTAAEIGEKKVIELIMKCLKFPHNMPVPFGDDVSAICIDENTLAVLKTDMLVGKTDVPQHMSFRQAARKAVVMNVSDFAAKGVKPVAVLASLGLSRDTTEEEVRQIGTGLNEAAREYGAYVIGGDTNESSDLVISCSLFGICDKNLIIKRSGARPGDIVAATGLFGQTAAGLKILLENLEASSEIKEPLINSVLMPKARLREGLALAETGGLTASIDSSDGLAWSLHELSEASNVGFNIENVPLAPEVMRFAEIHGLDPLELGLYGGEEYEIIFTVKPELWSEVEEVAGKVDFTLTQMGKATKEKRVKLKLDKETRTIKRRGWEHFKT
jgi:thiamine-monophosphate kinase